MAPQISLRPVPRPAPQPPAQQPAAAGPPSLKVATPPPKLGVKPAAPAVLRVAQRSPAQAPMPPAAPKPAAPAAPPAPAAATPQAPPARPRPALPAALVPAGGDLIRMRRRPSAEQRRHAVLDVMAGGDPRRIADRLGIAQERLDRWVREFVESGERLDPQPGSVDTLKTQLAEVLATARVLEKALGAALQPPAPTPRIAAVSSSSDDSGARPRRIALPASIKLVR
jgi:transposase-like protein